MALLLTPTEAILASVIGGIISIYVAPAQAMFGIYSVLLPVAGATFGSLAYHKKREGLLSTTFLVVAIAAYLNRNLAFPYFVLPHAVAAVLIIIGLNERIRSSTIQVPLYTFASTMCEQGMMMIFAVYLLGLPAQVFSGILPLMLYERIIATIGSTFIILAVRRALPQYLK